MYTAIIIFVFAVCGTVVGVNDGIVVIADGRDGSRVDPSTVQFVPDPVQADERGRGTVTEGSSTVASGGGTVTEGSGGTIVAQVMKQKTN